MVEGSDAYSLVDASKMSLVPDLALPPKFKVPTFDKYDGTNTYQHICTSIARR